MCAAATESRFVPGMQSPDTKRRRVPRTIRQNTSMASFPPNLACLPGRALRADPGTAARVSQGGSPLTGPGSDPEDAFRHLGGCCGCNRASAPRPGGRGGHGYPRSSLVTLGGVPGAPLPSLSSSQPPPGPAQPKSSFAEGSGPWPTPRVEHLRCQGRTFFFGLLFFFYCLFTLLGPPHRGPSPSAWAPRHHQPPPADAGGAP